MLVLEVKEDFMKKVFLIFGFIFLPVILFFLYRYFWINGTNLYQPWGISLCIIMYFLGGYLLSKKSAISVLGGFIIFFTTVTAATIIISVPITSWPTFVFNIIGSLCTFGVGLFLVSRNSCFLRSWGICVILATLFIGLFSGIVSLGDFVKEREVTDQNKQKVISETEPMIDDFFVAWNKHDYGAFTKNMSDKAKEEMSEMKFTYTTYAQFGDFVSKENPIVYQQNFNHEIDYIINFTKDKNMLAHFQVSKLSGQYLITGFKLEPAEGSTTHQKK
jgi:hypothetical protein